MSETLSKREPGLDYLLEPISAHRPCGEFLLYEGTYDAIQEARREEDPSLPQGVWQRAVKVADWKTVEQLCLQALEKRSKDLQLVAWLSEALLALHGPAGCGRGWS